MSFLYPSFLFALFAISIPIIIHLFYFRRFRKLYFSNTSFLSFIKTEKRTKNNLKHLIILLLRILAVASLVFAFAQPFIPVENSAVNSGQNAVSIYIDNSFSMENINNEGSLLEEAKKIAQGIIQAHGNNDKFQVITQDMSARQQRFYSKEEVKGLIDDIDFSPESRNLENIYEKQQQKLNETNTSNRLIYMISDFQKSTSSLADFEWNPETPTYILPVLPAKFNNIYIDSVWFEKPILQLNQSASLKVRIRNETDKDISDASLNLRINDQPKGLASFSLPSGQSSIVTLSFSLNKHGWNQGKLLLEDYPISFDDTYFFSFFVAQNIRILELFHEKPSIFLQTVFKTDEYFKYESKRLDAVDISGLNNYQLLIINEPDRLPTGLITAFENFIGSGGNLLLIPSPEKEVRIDDYNELLNNTACRPFIKLIEKETAISKINLNENITEGVFEELPDNINLPKVYKYYQRNQNSFSKEIPLLELENGEQFLSMNTYKNGKLFILNSALNEDWGNFPKHAIFVPLMYKIALFRNNNTAISLEKGSVKNLSIGTNQEGNSGIYTFETKDERFIPNQNFYNGNLNIFIDNQFKDAGFYSLYPKDKYEKKPVSVVALNYNRIESDPEAYSVNELESLSEDLQFTLIESKADQIQKTLEEIKHGKPLWKLFLLFALAFLLAEILLIRFWK